MRTVADLIETVPKTQATIAAELGISRGYLGQIKGGLMPPRWTRARLCAYFEVDELELKQAVLASAVARETRRRERMLAGAT